MDIQDEVIVDPVAVDKPVFGGEPALAIGGIAALVVALLSIFDIVVDVDTVTAIIVSVVPLIAAILTRFKVTPVRKVK